MQEAHVPGVIDANNKDDLIRIMCKFNCVYSTEQLPTISLGSQLTTSSGVVSAPSNQKILECVRKMQTVREEQPPTIAVESSSDSEAPISKGAIAQAKAAAAAAAKTALAGKTGFHEKAAARRVVAETATAKIASKKQHAAIAQEDCTGVPKYDLLCTCDFCMNH
jgi:hypothetical protein